MLLFWRRAAGCILSMSHIIKGQVHAGFCHTRDRKVSVVLLKGATQQNVSGENTDHFLLEIIFNSLIWVQLSFV